MEFKLNRYKKTKFSKTSKIIITFILIFLTLGVVYAALISDLSIVSNLTILKTEPHIPFPEPIETLINTRRCINRFTGNITDQVGNTNPAKNVFFNNCPNERNIIFGGFCWEMIRTTETGGIKMIYNGEPVNGKCESTRSTHKGVVGANAAYTPFSSSYLYGSSYTYDENNNTFTLVDTFTGTWNDSTYQNFIGKFTCRSTSNTCTTIYNLTGYYSNTQAYATAFTVDSNVDYSAIGKSPYNGALSLDMAGYKYNNSYVPIYGSFSGANTIKYGNSFTYNSGTNTYTLSGTTNSFSDWSTGYNTINNTHYTCFNESGTCEQIKYIYATPDTYAYYINISNGKSVENAVNEMLVNNDINNHDSTIKKYIDIWFNKKLLSYNAYIEDTVYCNERTVNSLGGWNPNGGNTYLDIDDPIERRQLLFNGSGYVVDGSNLSCPNITDQFTVSNNAAKLTYPIALPTIKEMYHIEQSLRANPSWYNTMSPSYYGYNFARMRLIYANGEYIDNEFYSSSNSGNVRPMISLKNSIIISGGNGSETDPWIIAQ